MIQDPPDKSAGAYATAYLRANKILIHALANTEPGFSIPKEPRLTLRSLATMPNWGERSEGCYASSRAG